VDAKHGVFLADDGIDELIESDEGRAILLFVELLPWIANRAEEYCRKMLQER